MNNMWTRQSLSSRTAKRIFSALSEQPPSTIQVPTRAWSYVQGTRNTKPSRHFSSINRPTTATIYSQRSSPLHSRLQFFQNQKNNRSHRRFNHSKSDNQTSSSSSTSFSARWKKLSKEYGWAAVGIYLALSALDFPFCFAAVRLLGVERIGYLEHLVVDSVKSALGWVSPLPSGGESTADGVALTTDASTTTTAAEDGVATYDHGVVEAQEKNASEQASIWTQLALAYAIHKSFIFIRIPLTAAITPKIVKILRRWGWDIGKKAVPKGK